ncbi:hypothetical protein [Streptomyces niveus]|uniref:hypothetical protein n=1 Tax=Streptomyces niveus TaxID=193462 RepID=UPI0036AC58AB
MLTLTAPAAAPDTSTGDHDDDLTHTFCLCDPDTALCGADLTGTPVSTDPLDLLCVVCEDLLPHHCPRCCGDGGCGGGQ